MSVLVECYSVIVKRDDLEERFPGGLDAYATLFPGTFCMDEHLTRVGFMASSDLRGFAKHVLSVTGLGGASDDDRFWVEPGAVAIVEQLSGVWPARGTPWLQYAEGDQRVCWCWLRGTAPGGLATPPGWFPDPTMTQLALRGAAGGCREEEGADHSRPDGQATVTLYHTQFFPESEDN